MSDPWDPFNDNAPFEVVRDHDPKPMGGRVEPGAKRKPRLSWWRRALRFIATQPGAHHDGQERADES